MGVMQSKKVTTKTRSSENKNFDLSLTLMKIFDDGISLFANRIFSTPVRCYPLDRGGGKQILVLDDRHEIETPVNLTNKLFCKMVH